MSQFLDDFEEWFSQLSFSQKVVLVQYICNKREKSNLDGYYAGPAPSQSSRLCPTCGKPL